MTYKEDMKFQKHLFLETGKVGVSARVNQKRVSKKI